MTSSRYTVTVQDRYGTWQTPRVSDVGFVRGPNGNVSATFALEDSRPFVKIGPDCKVRITDQWNTILWTGSVGIPGREVNGYTETGSQIGCFGNLAALSNKLYGFPYLVTRLDAWERDNLYASKPDAKTEAGSRPEAATTPCLSFQFAQSALYPGDRARMRFTVYEQDPMWALGGIGMTIDSGTTDSRFETCVYVGNAGWAHKPIRKTPPSTTSQHYSIGMDGTADKPSDQSLLSLEWRFNGNAGTTLTTDAYWTTAYDISIAAQRYTKAGDGSKQDLGSQYNVYANQIFEDVMGRILAPILDLPGSSIATGTALMQGLDYSTNPVTIASLFNDLVTVESNWYWYWGNEDIGGRAPLTAQPWPTAVRYMIPDRPGVVSSESGTGDSPLCDRVILRWTDIKGLRYSKTYIADRLKYPDLTRLPAIGRHYPDIDLGSSTSYQPTIDTIAANVLDMVARRPDDTSVTIDASVPITDATTGRVIPPDRIMPNNIVWVQSTRRALRCNQVEVSEGAAKLTLGTARKEPQQIINDALQRRRKR